MADYVILRYFTTLEVWCQEVRTWINKIIGRNKS